MDIRSKKVKKPDNSDDDEVYVLTEPYILYDILTDVFDVGDWKPGLWQMLYETFMRRLEKAGYIAKRDEGEEE